MILNTPLSSVAAIAVFGALSFLTNAVNVKLSIKKGEKQSITLIYECVTASITSSAPISLNTTSGTNIPSIKKNRLNSNVNINEFEKYLSASSFSPSDFKSAYFVAEPIPIIAPIE